MNHTSTNRRYEVVLLISLALLATTLAATLWNAALHLQVMA
jgi:hypothetical protein